MSYKLVRLLTDFVGLVTDYQFHLIEDEEIFLDQIQDLTDNIQEELKNQKLPTIEE